MVVTRQKKDIVGGGCTAPVAFIKMKTTTEQRIAIAVVYLGAFPNYFQLWLRSCESNPGITWFLFAEKAQMGNRPLPANVRYIEFSREAFTALVNQKIGIFPRQWRNYKICDFKPAFGHLLEEYFNGFHFWGYCDIDLLFENILQFLTSSVLANHDRIFAGGHFSLMKNSPRLCLLYQEGSGEFEFRHVFSTGKYLGLDEWNGFYRSASRRESGSISMTILQTLIRIHSGLN